MKKRSLLKTMLLLCALIVGYGSSWAGDVVGTINFGNASGSTKIQGSSSSGTGTVTYTDTGNDSQGNTWTITTVTSNDKSFTQSATYSQVGASSKPATSITFTTTLPKSQTIKAFSAKFGGFNSTAGDVTLKVGSTTVGSGSLNGTTDVTVSNTSSASGTVLTVTVTNISKGVKCYYISYTYNDGSTTETVIAPTFSPATGTYTSAQSVSISSETSGATIYYTMTTDGTTPDDPTEDDAKYSSVISVTKSGTIIKAKAFKSGMTASSVVSASYTIKPTTPTINAAGATVTITGDEGCDFYYTTNNTTPSKSSTKYTSAFDLTENCTIKAIAYDTNGNASDVKTYNYKYMPLAPKNINSNYYVRVTDVNSLENGDAILIVCETENAAMSTTQNNNNRAMEGVTIANEAIVPSDGVQKLILIKKTEKIDNVDTEVFYFYTGSGYLYAPSSSSNYLKTEATPDDNNNARATISISEGDATITFTGTSTHNLLKYNASSSIFSCYASGQEDVQIYKEVPAVTISASGYASYCSPLPLDLTPTDNYAAYVVTQVNKEAPTVMFEKITGAVPAETPFILYGKEAAGTTVTLPVATGATTAPENNMLIGTLEPTPITTVVGSFTNFGLSGGQFVKMNNGTIPANKAYLPVPTSFVTSSAPALTIVFGDDETTGIGATLNDSVNDNVIYDLSGRHVAQPTKGIYIMNGKKVVIK